MLDQHHFNMDTEYESDTIGLESTDPPRLHFEPPKRLHWDRPRPSMAKLGPLKLHNFDCNTDPDPGFHSTVMRIRIRVQLKYFGSESANLVIHHAH